MSLAEIEGETDIKLCKLFNDLTNEEKRVLWIAVGRAVGRGQEWAAKYYRNVFKKCLHSDPLD